MAKISPHSRGIIPPQFAQQNAQGNAIDDISISAVVSEVIIIISPVFTPATRDLSEFNEISGLHEVTLQLVVVMDSEFQVLHSSFSPLLVPIQLHSPPAAVYPAAPMVHPLPCPAPLSFLCCSPSALSPLAAAEVELA